jgi:hypothetical protein
MCVSRQVEPATCQLLLLLPIVQLLNIGVTQCSTPGLHHAAEEVIIKVSSFVLL